MPTNESSIDWGRANWRFQQRLIPRKIEPAIDEPVSRIVGKKIYQLDPRVIKLVVKWKKSKPPESTEPDNFMQNPRFIEELKKSLSGNL